MDSKGWIRLDRNLLDHPLWKEKPFSKGQAWIDILLITNWKTSTDRVGGKKKKSKPGQRWTTLSELAARWGWSKESVRRFLRSLERDGCVSLYVTGLGTRLTVEKWALYQHDVSDDVSDDETVGELSTININKKEITTDPFGDEDEGMTEEELREYLRI